MGTWGTKLFENDTSCDVRDTCMIFLEKYVDEVVACEKTIEEYIELIGKEEEALLWYSLAYCQWENGKLMDSINEKALNWIEKNGALSLFENHQDEWIKTLKNLKQTLISTPPSRKTIKEKKEFQKNPWNVGDIYAYKFHSKLAKENGMNNKFIIFQKIGNVEYYKDNTFSLVQIYDKIFDELPKISEIRETRILPLISPPGVDGTPTNLKDFVPSFEYFMKATMIYNKPSDYPKNYFYFIGNKSIERKNYLGNDATDFYWQQNGMEEWLIDYYTKWKNVKY